MPIVLEPRQRFADVYRERLAPWLTPDLSVYAGAIGAMYEEVYDLITEEGSDGEATYVPPWGKLLDPDICPAWALPYLGQFVGVLNLVGVPEVKARQLIKAQVSMHRGTPQSIVNSAAATLTGSQSVVLTERWNADPYAIDVITYTAETPNQTETLKAILAVKPAGIVVNYRVLAGQTWGQLRDEAGGHTWTQVRSEYATWADARDDIP